MQVQVMQGNSIIISLRGAVATSNRNEPIGRKYSLQDQDELDTT